MSHFDPDTDRELARAVAAAGVALDGGSFALIDPGLWEESLPIKPGVSHDLGILSAHQWQRYGAARNAPSAARVLSLWRQRLRRLADEAGDATLLCLLSHAQPASGTAPSRFETAARADDPFITPYPISADAFLVLAASAGLFCEAPPRFSCDADGVRDRALYALSRRGFTVRFARSSDISALDRLERLCRAAPLRTGKRALLALVKRYPEGQFVLERDGEVKGVVYSQRIRDEADLSRCTTDDAHTLHDADGDVVQVLAVNIDPAVRHLGFGDQLLEFMLQRSSLQRGVRKIVMVARCKDYQPGKGLAFAEYATGPGRERDRGLHVHHAHGGRIAAILPGYRPRDLANEGKGVLICYEPERSRPRPGAAAAPEDAAVRPEALGAPDAGHGDVSAAVSARSVADRASAEGRAPDASAGDGSAGIVSDDGRAAAAHGRDASGNGTGQHRGVGADPAPDGPRRELREDARNGSGVVIKQDLELPISVSAEALEAARLPAVFERMGAEIVAAQLRTLYADAQGACHPAQAFAALRPSHRRWLDATLTLLEAHRLASVDASTGTLRFAPLAPVAELWQRWERAETEAGVDDNHRAYLVLIATCLRHLPDILSEAVPATDVMFPGSSVRLVEGIYKHNLIADHFNIVLREALRAELADKVAQGARELRLLEIGAGTGGTTATLLPMLRGFGDRLVEYRYTDLSRAFLIHAEEHYAPQLPALKTAIFDVCKPLAGQSVESGRYDAVIATNVLHATPSMRETLRNAKAALKRGGVLLVNEISDWAWYLHFTFGLLEGWWLYEDAALRVPGSPALSPAGWARLLRAERFHDVRFPGERWHGLGQQIIAARSDGVVRQRLLAPAAQPAASATVIAAAPAAAPAAASSAPAAPAVRPAAEPAAAARRPAMRQAARTASSAPVAAGGAGAGPGDEDALRAACTQLFLENIASALRLDAREIETGKPLEHYGLDSILVVKLTTQFRKLFPSVRSTLFFEVKSVDGLVQHFFANERDALAAVLVERGLVRAAGPAPQPVAAAAAAPSPIRSAALPTAGGPVDEGALRAACTQLFLETIASALRLDAREIETGKPLEHYGLDSILVVKLTTQFRKLFPSVRSTLFFEVKSVDGLVQHFFANERDALAAVLVERGLVRDAAPSAPAVAASAPSPAAPAGDRGTRRRFAPRRAEAAQSQPEAPAQAPVPSQPATARSAPAQAEAAQGEDSGRFDVAVIGVSGRYPQSPDLDRFWDNLAAGRSCVGEIPADRWNWQDFFDAEKGKPGKTYTKWGGFLSDIDKFDPLFFRIAPKEAKRIDPQERLFLETSYHAIEDSGYTPDTLCASRKVGVFVGVMNSRYTVQPLYYSIANRVSFLFDFNGPSFAVDSACSSSLTSVHLAIDSLRSGLCEVAIAGGVSLIVDPQHMVELAGLGMLSEGAQCRSFGRNADGFVDAEGVGAVVLKPLSAALRDGDNIQAVIRGSALNTGGRTHGYTVPSPVAQSQVVSTALARAEVDPADVGYIEAHGTGTSLGDPIEISGLTRAFRGASGEVGRAGRTCAIGSLKSNIGHCESAAGIAGLTKVLLQLRHGQLVPTLHAEIVNDEIDFAATPFRLQRELGPWPRWQRPDGSGEVPRIAGVSSFGAGGANAHIVVEEAPPRVDVDVDAGVDRWLVPLSARTPAQLEEKLQQLLAFLQRDGLRVRLSDLAYTLQVGREAMDERIALVATSLDDLRRQLSALVQGRASDPAPQRGNARKQKEFLAACRSDPGFAARCDGWLAERDFDQLAAHWARGVDIDWSRLYGQVRPRRISLPTYPFARERHWIDPQRTLGSATTVAASHPLLRRDTSTLQHPAYSIELKGDEPSLDVDTEGRRSLSLLLCAEMARAAAAAAYPDDLAGRALHLESLEVDVSARIDGACALHVVLLADGEDALRFEIYSESAGVETVHCQGLGRFVQVDAAEAVDAAALSALIARGTTAGEGIVQRIARNGGQVVMALDASAASVGEPWWLSPALCAAIVGGIAFAADARPAFGGAAAGWSLRSADALAFAIARVQPAFAVLDVRTHGRDADADVRCDAMLCDASGTVLLRATGLDALRADAAAPLPASPERADESGAAFAAQAAPQGTSALTAPAAAAAAAAEDATPQLSRAGTPVAFPRMRTSAPIGADGPGPLAKPNAIRLVAVERMAAPAADARIARPVFSLAAPDAGVDGATTAAFAAATEGGSGVALRDLGAGAYAVTLPQAMLTAAAVADLLAVFARIGRAEDARVLVIEGGERAFLRGDAAALRQAIAAGLFRALGECPAVTIAAMRGDADGAGFLFAALCDFAIADRDARYAYADPDNGLQPTAQVAELLRLRFGAAQADDLLYVTGRQRGSELVRKGWTLPVVAAADVADTAFALAQSLVGRPTESLRLLKRHLARDLSAAAGSIDIVGDGVEAVAVSGAPLRLPKARPGIVLEALPGRVVGIRLSDAGPSPSPAALLGALSATLAELAERGDAAALVLGSAYRGFLPELADGAAEDALIDVVDALSTFPAPVFVACERDADAAGWLLAQAADACVHAEGGACAVGGLWDRPRLLRMFAARLERDAGREAALRVLFGAETTTAAQLAPWAGAHVADDAWSAAQALAASSPLRMPALRAQWRAGRVPRAVEDAVVAAAADAARTPPPQSSVIETEWRDNGVLLVRMVERAAKNMFSPALIQGIEAIFAWIRTHDACRAVVLTGFDTYFACGGTRESLLAIQEGKARFTDTKLYHMPMDCPVPVIAAMQGHGIGGGWSLGMFADVRLFSAESRYISPYMRYGFTPGAGATLVFPMTMGLDLAREVLFTANEYTGRQLQARGMHDACLPRGELPSRALALADAIAARPRAEVVALKRHFSAPGLAAIEDVYSRELAMHSRSFVGKGEVIDGVMRHFLDEDGGGAPRTPADAVPSPEAGASPPAAAAAADLPASEDLAAALKAMLAIELQLSEDDIDEDTPFVDLGLDSITGVTWVRKINARYGTRIEATKVYSHPNLRAFVAFVAALTAGAAPARTGEAGAARPAARQPATLQPATQAPTAQQSAARPVAATAATAAVRTASAAAPARDDAEALAELMAELARMLAQELQLSEDEIDPQRQFVELGLDSITGVTWVRKINARYGTRIEATKVYSHPTLDAFTRFVAGAMPASARPQPAAAPAVESAAALPAAPRPPARALPAVARQTQGLRSWRQATTRSASARRKPAAAHARGDEAIAIIGMAGQFPQAPDLSAFWRNIAAGRDCIDIVPAQRFDIERYFSDDISIPGTTNSRWMGVLPDVDAFDPLFFNIAPTEAESMDPQQRLMLQNCWHAIEDAAIDPRSLSGSLCGVFIGCGATDYHERSRAHRLSAQGFTGAAMSILAARIAYLLNLQGPCISVDTACSSSLVAIANACDNLAAGHCDIALAGGVAVMAGPAMHVKTGQSAMLSTDGRCFTFDHRANGFVPAEGVGAVLLKRLSDAERDGDIIHAVIRGWGVNQDGKTNGITAPNPVSQTRLLRTVYDRYGIDPEDIQMVEAHGTGTKLGDPIEVEGLNNAFRHYTDKTGYCTLGSVKSNVGHCLFAAGIAGVMKVAMALRHRQLPPAANFERLNPHIDLDGTPFTINTRLRPWPENASGGRTAVVSSFGFSGTNVHLVLEQAPASASVRRAAAADDPSQPVLVPLSARSREQLLQRARDLEAFLAAADADADALPPALADIAYTLQVGREAMDERLAFVARTVGELRERLRAFVSGARGKGLHVGSAQQRATKLAFLGQDRDLKAVLVETCLRDGKLDKLAELWVDGFDFDWAALHPDTPRAQPAPRRISLPLYPFAKERYWLEDDETSSSSAAGAGAILHPLVHANVSTLRQQRYRTTLRGDEFFLRDHRVRIEAGRIERVLPGVAYLEMAAVAIRDAMPEVGEDARLVLSDIAWWRPVVASAATTLDIDLGLDDTGAVRFEIASVDDAQRLVHCQGEAMLVALDAPPAVDVSTLERAGEEVWRAEDIYAAFDSMGLHYGHAHRGLRSLSRAGARLLARVAKPPIADDPGGFGMHPGVMDAALQACVGFLPSLANAPGSPAVPFALRTLKMHAPCPADAVVLLTASSPAVRSVATATCDLAIYAPDGTLCIEIEGFSWRAMERTVAAATAEREPASRAVGAAPDPADEGFDEAMYLSLLDSISNQELSAEEAAELGLMS